MSDELAVPAEVLHVRQSYRDPRNDHEWDMWTTSRELMVQADEMIWVKPGFETDLISVPKAVSWFVPRAGRFARAAVLHDYLWSVVDGREEDVKGVGKDRRLADRRLRLALQAAEVSLLKRWIMWAAVRISAIFFKRDGGENWPYDIPAILVLLFVAVPIVAPAALVISVSIVVFNVLEWIVWAGSLPLPGESERPPGIQWKT